MNLLFAALLISYHLPFYDDHVPSCLSFYTACRLLEMGRSYFPHEQDFVRIGRVLSLFTTSMWFA